MNSLQKSWKRIDSGGSMLISAGKSVDSDYPSIFILITHFEKLIFFIENIENRIKKYEIYN